MNDSFKKNGFLVLRDFIEKDKIKNIIEDIEELGTFIDKSFDFSKDKIFRDEKYRSILYDNLRYIPSIYKMAGSNKILNLCKQLDIKKPGIMKSCNLRIDEPNDNLHLFDWHQDTLYLLGSQNALTIWIPLVDVNKLSGTIEVIKGSHLNGIYDYEKISNKSNNKMDYLLQRDIKLKEVPKNFNEEDYISIDAKVGDVVVFYQTLLHRSLPNFSNKTRWSMQLRITDLLDKEYYLNGSPQGELTNIYHVNYKNNYKY